MFGRTCALAAALAACGRVGYFADPGLVDGDGGGADGTLPAGAFRRPIVVEAPPSAAVESGYAVSITIDHAALVADGKAKVDGGDLRIVYQSSDDPIELPLVLDPRSSWLTANTRVWFAIADTIAAGTTSGDRYFLVYGDPQAGAPQVDLDRVFSFGDSFDDGAISDSLVTSIEGNATIAETGGALDVVPAATVSSAAVISTATPLPATRGFQIAQRARLMSASGPFDPEVKLVGIADAAATPSVAAQDEEWTRRRIVIFQRGDGEVWIFYFQDGGQQMYWNGSAWIQRENENGVWTKRPLGEYMDVTLTSNGTSWRVDVADPSGATLTATTDAPWSSLQGEGAGTLWAYWGEPYTDFYSCHMQSDWIFGRPYVEPEPVVRLGDEQ